jgi:diaminohydroxyphosphoribosylaminopyrimidine deaminase/5-amino-6-(5-phosphoribosylamino)uracil reductase
MTRMSESRLTASDYGYVSRAIQLAKRGLYTTDPNPRVGCVIVKEGKIVGEGWHERAGGPHAEVMALQAAGDAAKGADVYVSLEPCSHHGRTPPCADALVEASVARVVAAMEDPNPQVAGQGMARLQAAGTETASGILQAQAEALNPGYIQRMRTGKPLVRMKQAMSLDGRTAMASGESQWITGTAARADVHRLRARSSAMVTGVNTVLADDPSLNARLKDAEVHQPIRVILDSQLQTPPIAKMLSLPGRTLVMTLNDDDSKADALRAAGAEVITLDDDGQGRISLSALLAFLAREQVNEVMVEAGPTLGGTFVAAGLVDELIIYMAPSLMGDTARGLLHLPGIECMADKLELDITDMRALGRDWRITARLRQPDSC